MTKYGSLPIDKLMLPPAALTGERRYQREADLRRQRNMADNYDPDLDQPLSVCAVEDGMYEIADGQHRYGMHQILGTPRVQVKFLNGGKYTTVQERARYFLALSRGTIRLRAFDDFNASIVAEEPLASDIEKVANRHGVRVGKRAGDDVITISGLKSVVNRAGLDILSEAIAVSHEAWPEPGAERHVSHLLVGLSYFIREAIRSGKYDRKRLIRRLSRLTARDMQFEARVQSANLAVGYNTPKAWAMAVRKVSGQAIEFLEW